MLSSHPRLQFFSSAYKNKLCYKSDTGITSTDEKWTQKYLQQTLYQNIYL
jgi:hypothetical protein